MAPDSSDKICRSRSGRSASAALPVTTLDASTGSVGQIAVPSSSATLNVDPRIQAVRPVEIKAMAGMATNSRMETGRSCARTERKG